MYKIGEFVYDTLRHEKVQILDKIIVWGFVSYKVFNPSENTVYKVSKEHITTHSDKQIADVNYLRYITLLSKIKNEMNMGLISNLSNGIIPLPHQKHVLTRAVSNNNVRYILADEVGLGKTIEAGLIIKELKARGLIKRVLIVCPKGLVTQWRIEMKEKFGEKYHIILPEDYNTIKKINDSEDVYGQFEQVISPLDSIKPLLNRIGWSEDKIKRYNEERIYSIINSGWDLVIIDEAHRVAGSSGEVARYKLAKLLASASPHLLLLTATPHNGKTEPFLRLVRLLDEQAFPNYKAIVKEQVAPYVIRTEKREAIDNFGKKLFKNRITKVIEINWDDRHSLQKELYKLTSNYVAKGYNKAVRNKGKYMWLIFLLIMMQRLVTSSTSAIRQSLEKRLKVLEEQDFKINNLSEEEFAELDFEDNIDDTIKATSLDIREEIKEVSEILLVAKQAEFQYLDAKVEPLIEIVDNLFSNDKDQKLIVFTEFVATQKYLNNLLKKRGFTTSLLNGSMSIDERNIVLEEFKTKASVLISTDAGGEGLNLQFSNIVVNYDLPWNPMKIEQRIGRIDRIGQTRDVQIYNLILTETIEKRVKDVLEQKLSVILNEIGIDKYSDVLDNELTERNITAAYLNSIYTPEKIEHNLKPIEKDLKTQIQNANKIKDIIHEEKDLSSLIVKESNFNVGEALSLLISYYGKYTGSLNPPINNISINDSQITKHLHHNIVFNRLDGAMVVEIQDFPNEKGYFGLWEISLNDHPQAKRIIPVFINDNFILRPLAGQKIWDEMLKSTSKINIKQMRIIDYNIFLQINNISRDFAHETFLNMKYEFEKKNEESYGKYLYAINLRIEAAKNISIKNIKLSKLKSLTQEKEMVVTQHKINTQLYPDFKPIFLAYMEG
ncbi:DEAD/DEAH box helicase [Bacillus sp. JJ1562]|uniref:DEAD/DEAH box helicase n=1 Tax=Bacillus sp. JJ1562 TaxID=3122960 RepID=UPI003003138B